MEHRDGCEGIFAGVGVWDKDPTPQGLCWPSLIQKDELEMRQLPSAGPKIVTISSQGFSFGKRESKEGLRAGWRWRTSHLGFS